MADEWNGALPTDDLEIPNIPGEHRATKVNVAAVLEKEHVTLGDGNSGGEHKQGSAVAWYLATASIPALQPDGTALTSTDNGRLWIDLTTGIMYILVDYSNPTVGNGWIPIGEYLGNIAINTDKFTVERATGNMVAGIATVAKGSLLASSDAPTTDAMIVPKKFVDERLQTVSTQSGAVNTGTTVIPINDSIPQITEGDEYLTRTITPVSATSILNIRATVMVASSAAVQLVAALFVGTTANALTTVSQEVSGTNVMLPLNLEYSMISGVTSELTFRVRVGGSSSGTTTFNGAAASRLFGGTILSTLTVTEVR